MAHHEHHHDHGHHCHCGCGADIHVTIHDGAVAASFEKTVAEDPAVVEQKIQEQMLHLAQHLREHNAVIGHIKCALASGGTTVMLSLTKSIVNRTVCGSETEDRISIHFAAIALNVDEAEMEELLHEIYHGLD